MSSTRSRVLCTSLFVLVAACGGDPFQVSDAGSPGGDGRPGDGDGEGDPIGGDGVPAGDGDGANPGDGTDGDASVPPEGPHAFVAALRTVVGNQFLGTERTDGGAVVATARTLGDRETLSLIDMNGGRLESGDAVRLRTQGGQYLRADEIGVTAMIASPGTAETFTVQKVVGGGPIVSGERVGLSRASGAFLTALNGGGSSIVATGESLREWETFELSFRAEEDPAPGAEPDFGSGAHVFDPSMSASEIQAVLDRVFGEMESNHFGPQRHALLFKPGSYAADVNVGFFTQAIGLGVSPDNTLIQGAVHAEADWFQGNATQNFWRGAENLAVLPEGGENRWAVSQAAPFRRMHVRGNVALDDNGWSSGGLIADSQIDGQINSGSQQQFLTRTSEIGSWAGSNWNMVFVGVDNAPSSESWPDPPHTVVAAAPVLREKPSLVYDPLNGYRVYLPRLQKDVATTSWRSGKLDGAFVPLSAFHVARANDDDAASINAALAAGKHVLFTPGVYRIDQTLHVERANTIVLGLGLATLIPDNGVDLMHVDDVDGVRIAGILFDAGPVNSKVLLEVGTAGSHVDHAANPTSLHDVYFRIGGAAVGKATDSLVIHSDDVIGDHTWIWRADHGSGVGWNTNTAAHGLIVNGEDVTIYGLFVEHYQGVQTTWNANGGRVYFYQSEIPYDPPNQESWRDGNVNGFTSYRVADSVTTHEAHGLGIYCYFNVNPSVKLENAIEVPQHGLNGAMFHHMTTVSLGGNGEITHVIEGYGDAANGARTVVRLAQ